MGARIGPSDRRKALRAIRQRGITVQVGALEELYSAFDQLLTSTFKEFLDKCLDILARPGATKEGILTKDLAQSIGERLLREDQRRDGVAAASVEVIDSFKIPKWRPQPVASSSSGSAGRKVEAASRPIINAPPIAKAEMFRNRYELILSKTLRNPRFKPPSSTAISMGKKSPFFQLTGIESLSGSKGEKFVLGMLTQLEEGIWYLEDLNGTVKLDLSQTSITAGLHTECSFVILQGTVSEEVGQDLVFQVSAMGTPPFEKREDTIAALGKDANLFGGQFDPNDTVELLQMEAQAEDNAFMFVSDVYLDRPSVMAGLRHVFKGYLEDNFVPSVIVLIGQFLSHPFGQDSKDIKLLIDKFGELGTMIKTEFEPLAQETTFVIVPGTLDAGPGNVLPKPPMPEMLTRKFVQALGKDRVRLATNPCRIRYMTQEIVILRDNLVQKMIRHCSVKPDFNESGLTSEHMVKTVVDQAYLCPLPLIARPVLWNHDHALWLFPTPHVVVLADRIDSYICEYGGSLGLNPGSFATNFSFQMYLPAQRRAQQCSIESEDVSKAVEETQQEALRKIEKENERRQVRREPEPAKASVGDEMEISRNDSEEKERSDHDRNNLESVEEAADVMDLDAVNVKERKEMRETQEVQEEEETEQPSDVQQPEPENISDAQNKSDSEAEESDDDSVLLPAKGLKRLDIKALLRDSNAFEDTYPPRPSEEDDEDENSSDRDEEGGDLD